MNEYLILGAGTTGLSAGIGSGRLVYEATDIPGGICASYYVSPENKKAFFRKDEETYRFEIGGGHWIFGGDNSVLEFINRLSPVRSYERRSAVYFPDWDLYVPYPLQNHLSYLPKDIAQKALEEILQSDHTKDATTMADWLMLHFGKTLCELFFFPFHELYTANIFTKIEPQDKYKTPIDREQIIRGFTGKTLPVGYNATFVYPERGLNDLMTKMAEGCKINYHKEVAEINTKRREILFKDMTGAKYESLISTLPLNRVIKLTKLSIEKPESPHTSVLVINIGARKAYKCPDHHWLYIPKSESGFHRVGFYSNVDPSFLPKSSRSDNDRVSIYVEKAYSPEKRPKDEEINKLCDEIVKELQNWRFIYEAEVIDPTWIEVAYTWSYPGHEWKQSALDVLRNNDIYQIGRYGLWEFQGIAESIEAGLEIKHAR